MPPRRLTSVVGGSSAGGGPSSRCLADGLSPPPGGRVRPCRRRWRGVVVDAPPPQETNSTRATPGQACERVRRAGPRGQTSACCHRRCDKVLRSDQVLRSIPLPALLLTRPPETVCCPLLFHVCVQHHHTASGLHNQVGRRTTIKGMEVGTLCVVIFLRLTPVVLLRHIHACLLTPGCQDYPGAWPRQVLC